MDELTTPHGDSIPPDDEPSSESQTEFQSAAAKVRAFPRNPGVYLFKDNAGRVIYVGKAKNLRARASSYFHVGAAAEVRVRDWLHEIVDVDFLECAIRQTEP